MSPLALPTQSAHQAIPYEGNEIYRAHPRRRLQHPLSEAELAHVDAHGWVILRGRFSSVEAGLWKDECQRILDGLVVETANLRMEDVAIHSQTGAAVPWKLEPLIDLSPVFNGLVRDRRICDALASIYGGREPRLLKDKMLFKPPGAPGSNLHQDGAYWQGFPKSLYSVMIGVDAATMENGCTCMYDGAQQGLMTPVGSMVNVSMERIDVTSRQPVLTQPGDIAIFHQYVPHNAGPNTSDDFRRQIFLTYNDSADGEWYQAHRDHVLWYRTRHLNDEERSRRYFR